MSVLRLSAPVKINLFLHVLGRRDDGYHRLQTLFHLLDFGDELDFDLREDGEIRFSCSDPQLESKDNLVVRAALNLRTTAGSPLGAEIRLRKKVPAGGGLGGGSSDAATTLLALNQLWQCNLTMEQLEALGRALGADVPVFVQGKTAWAEGVGEQLQALELPEFWYLVLWPPVQVSTAQVFRHPELTRDSAAITVAAFLGQGNPNSVKDLIQGMFGKNCEFRNDCQTLVAKLYPEVAEVITWLQQQAPTRLTGTGASVFAVFETESAAREVLSQSPWPGFVAKGVNQSPVHTLLKTRD